MMVIQVMAKQGTASCYGNDAYAYGWAGEEACRQTTQAIKVSLFDFTVMTYNTNSH